MFTQVQKRKIHHLFNVLDENDNGYLQVDDFTNVATKIIHQIRFDLRSRNARLILLKANRLFVQLATDIHSPEMTISLYDWINFFRDELLAEDKEGLLNNYINRTCRHIFNLFDLDGDNFISRKEYANMFSTYGINNSHSDVSFDELDTNGDQLISGDELIAGLQNFFKSADPYTQGNLIFGEWK